MLNNSIKKGIHSILKHRIELNFEILPLDIGVNGKLVFFSYLMIILVTTAILSDQKSLCPHETSYIFITYYFFTYARNPDKVSVF